MTTVVDLTEQAPHGRAERSAYPIGGYDPGTVVDRWTLRCDGTIPCVPRVMVVLDFAFTDAGVKRPYVLMVGRVAEQHADVARELELPEWLCNDVAVFTALPARSHLEARTVTRLLAYDAVNGDLPTHPVGKADAAAWTAAAATHVAHVASLPGP